jgi:hypothetical protein
MIVQRAIGPIGTIARIAVGLALIALAVILDGVGWRDLALGLIAIPAVVLLGQLVRLHVTRTPMRATGPLGHLLNCLVVAALLVPSATRPAALVWLGVSMLLAAWRGYAGCESLAISNWLLRRDDQVGCVVFWPLDEIEARMAGNTMRDSAR